MITHVGTMMMYDTGLYRPSKSGFSPSRYVLASDPPIGMAPGARKRTQGALPAPDVRVAEEASGEELVGYGVSDVVEAVVSDCPTIRFVSVLAMVFC